MGDVDIYLTEGRTNGTDAARTIFVFDDEDMIFTSCRHAARHVYLETADLDDVRRSVYERPGHDDVNFGAAETNRNEIGIGRRILHLRSTQKFAGVQECPPGGRVFSGGRGTGYICHLR